jgi:signal transduction histidine kinase
MQSASLKNQLTEEATYYSKILESSVAESVVSLRIDRIRENIFFLKQNPLLEYAYVIDNNGSIISDGEFRSSLHFTIPDDEIHQNAIKSDSVLVQQNEEFVDVSTPIQLGTEKLGYVRIGLSKHIMHQDIANFRLISIAMGLAFILFGSILSYFVVLRISKPLKKLTDLTYEISKGKFDTKINIKTTDELNSLANAFNEMSANLSETRSSLISAKNEAEKSNRLKTEFLAQISHEIRTPINTLLNYSTLIKELLDSEDNSEINEYFKVMTNAGKRITRTIDLTLNMSEIIRDNYNPSYETFDINRDILSGLYKEFKSSANVKKLDMIFEQNDTECLVYTDKYTAAQIFQNLIDNSIKYTKEGFVKIVTDVSPEEVTVSIIDSGEGISEEFQKSVFEPFRQEEQGYTRKYEGAGLGLSLVYKYCELTGAKIDFSSEKGKGTTFNVTFQKGK